MAYQLSEAQKERKRQRERARYAANREAQRKRGRDYYAKNRKTVIARTVAYWHANKNKNPKLRASKRLSDNNYKKRMRLKRGAWWKRELVRKQTRRKYGKLPIGYHYHHTGKSYNRDRFKIVNALEHNRMHGRRYA